MNNFKKLISLICFSLIGIINFPLHAEKASEEKSHFETWIDTGKEKLNNLFAKKETTLNQIKEKMDSQSKELATLIINSQLSDVKKQALLEVLFDTKGELEKAVNN